MQIPVKAGNDNAMSERDIYRLSLKNSMRSPVHASCWYRALRRYLGRTTATHRSSHFGLKQAGLPHIGAALSNNLLCHKVISE